MKCVDLYTGYVTPQNKQNKNIEQSKNNKTLFRYSSINKCAT